MNIFLIVIGAILVLICGFMCLATYAATKNQANWDDYYKFAEEKNLPATEEELYRVICKLKFWHSIGLILGILLLICGIILQISYK